MSNYTQQKFRLGTLWGQIGGTTPWPSLRSLELPWLGGISPMLVGG